MNKVDEILNYKRTADEDYYAILGCDENATVSVIIVAGCCSSLLKSCNMCK